MQMWIELLGVLILVVHDASSADCGVLDSESQQGREQILPYKKREYVSPIGDTLFEVNAKLHKPSEMYQGDILLPTAPSAESEEPWTAQAHSRARRQAMRDERYPNNIWGRQVNYFFDESATPEVQTAFKQGVAFWRELTCVNYSETDQAVDRIRVIRGQGCYSTNIGKLGGEQNISLGEGCESSGAAIHLLAHALGFLHTHSRTDRDSFISIEKDNIETGYYSVFNKETPARNFNFGVPYDYGSVMHYGANSASRNGLSTMLAAEPRWQDTMGSEIASFYDVMLMNALYQCYADCPPATSAVCLNGGVPHPRRCDFCHCPAGYGGKLCEQKPQTCGSEFVAQPTFQLMNDTIGDGSTLRVMFDKCYYWIKAPVGRKVEVKIRALSGYFIEGCIFGGVEIKSQQDQRQTGYRYCSPVDAGTTLISASNILPIITYNRYKSNSVQLFYRIAPPAQRPLNRRPTQVVEKPSETTESGDKPSGCQDKSSGCGFLALRGLCVHEDIRTQCTKSCDLC